MSRIVKKKKITISDSNNLCGFCKSLHQCINTCINVQQNDVCDNNHVFILVM